MGFVKIDLIRRDRCQGVFIGGLLIAVLLLLAVQNYSQVFQFFIAVLETWNAKLSLEIGLLEDLAKRKDAFDSQGTDFTHWCSFCTGFKGERENWRKGNTVAVKTHRFDEEHVSSFDGAIVIVRNPYKAIISEHNRKFGGHTGFASEKHYTQGTGTIFC